jgi:hypothetical protein
MNKKILIGSIIAICIFVGVSFTSVVGYRSVDSDVKVSPLFNIRSSRAIDEKSTGLSCEYVGMGEYINLLIPTRDDENNLFQNYIEKIQLMSDETFNRFVDLLIHRHQQNKDFKDVSDAEVITALYYLRENKEINVIKDNDFSTILATQSCTPTSCWFPLCIIFLLSLYLLTVIHFIISIAYPTCLPFMTRCGE